MTPSKEDAVTVTETIDPPTIGASLAVLPVDNPHPAARQRFSQDQIDLISRTIAPGTTNDELALFVKVAERTGLDPFARQIHALKRSALNEKTGKWEDRLSIQVGIDGFRLIAERTGQYVGRLGPYWCGEDGEWGIMADGKPKPWLADHPPAAALVGVRKRGWTEPLWAVARYASYVQTKKDGAPVRMWANMPDGQLGKCAEALALRGAFPAELSGLYTDDEMGQAQAQHEAAPLPPQSADEWLIANGWHSEADHAEHRQESDRIAKGLSDDDRASVKQWIADHTDGFKSLWTASQAAAYRSLVTELHTAQEARTASPAPETAPEAESPAPAPESAESEPPVTVDGGRPGEHLPDYVQAIIDEVKGMTLGTVKAALRKAKLDDKGEDAEVRHRLAEHMVNNVPADESPF